MQSPPVLVYTTPPYNPHDSTHHMAPTTHHLWRGVVLSLKKREAAALLLLLLLLLPAFLLLLLPLLPSPPVSLPLPLPLLLPAGRSSIVRDPSPVLLVVAAPAADGVSSSLASSNWFWSSSPFAGRTGTPSHFNKPARTR